MEYVATTTMGRKLELDSDIRVKCIGPLLDIIYANPEDCLGSIAIISRPVAYNCTLQKCGSIDLNFDSGYLIGHFITRGYYMSRKDSSTEVSFVGSQERDKFNAIARSFGADIRKLIHATSGSPHMASWITEMVESRQIHNLIEDLQIPIRSGGPIELACLMPLDFKHGMIAGLCDSRARISIQERKTSKCAPRISFIIEESNPDIFSTIASLFEAVDIDYFIERCRYYGSTRNRLFISLRDVCKKNKIFNALVSKRLTNKIKYIQEKHSVTRAKQSMVPVSREVKDYMLSRGFKALTHIGIQTKHDISYMSRDTAIDAMNKFDLWHSDIPFIIKWCNLIDYNLSYEMIKDLYTKF